MSKFIFDAIDANQLLVVCDFILRARQFKFIWIEAVNFFVLRVDESYAAGVVFGGPGLDVFYGSFGRVEGDCLSLVM